MQVRKLKYEIGDKPAYAPFDDGVMPGGPWATWAEARNPKPAQWHEQFRENTELIQADKVSPASCTGQKDTASISSGAWQRTIKDVDLNWLQAMPVQRYIPHYMPGTIVWSTPIERTGVLYPIARRKKDVTTFSCIVWEDAFKHTSAVWKYNGTVHFLRSGCGFLKSYVPSNKRGFKCTAHKTLMYHCTFYLQGHRAYQFKDKYYGALLQILYPTVESI